MLATPWLQTSGLYVAKHDIAGAEAEVEEHRIPSPRPPTSSYDANFLEQEPLVQFHAHC